MKVCGVDIKGKEIILVVVEIDSDDHFNILVKSKKIPITDENDVYQLRSVKDTLESILREHQVELIGITGHSSRGQFAASAPVYKLEAVVQLNDLCSSKIIHRNTVLSVSKDRSFPVSSPKYAQDALNVAIVVALKESDNV
ncbi:MAG: DUF3010 family protein [Magnetococcales bacterium]|nr:DUF3010 family protein [Magnetococcales bacterium]